MPSYKVKVKWGKEVFKDVCANTEEEPMVFKAQLYALTGVEPSRQKVMIKGATLKDEGWGSLAMRENATVLLMGSTGGEIVKPAEKTQFIEDMDESAISSAMDLPAGLENMGNTCYLNATVQCLKTVPEFRGSLGEYDGRENITAALRDLYKEMDKGGSTTVFPTSVLRILRQAIPRFAEPTSRPGIFQQQDANECWVEMLRMLQQHLPAQNNSKASSIIDQYFGGEFDTEVKCTENDEEPATKSKEAFLQYSCFIDKEVKFLNSGLKSRLNESLTKFSSTLNRDAVYSKSSRVSRLPAYLTIQMVRFRFKQREAVNAKILKDIKFPLMLDTYELCSEELQKKLLPMRKNFKEYEDKLIEKVPKASSRESVLKKDREEKESSENFEPFWFDDDIGSNNSGFYELKAILTHKGRTSNSGHYVAWIRHKGDAWMECNDEDVRAVHVDDVLKLSGGGEWHSAYVLLYGPRKLPKNADCEPSEESKSVEAMES